jgi:hypothetical protein
MKTKFLLFLIIICGLEFVSQHVCADGVYLGGWSHHFNANKFKEHGWDLNENHRMIAIEYNNYLGGHFYNSYGDSTYFVAKYFKAFSLGDLEFGANIGASYGYKFCEHEDTAHKNSQLCVMAGPTISYTKYTIQPTLIGLKNGVVFIFKIGF